MESNENNNKSSKIKKSKKKKKKISDSEDNEEEEEDGGGEEIIKRRIIKRTKESNNKNPKQAITKITHGDVVEIKHLSENKKTKKTKKKAKKIKKTKDSDENDYENENIDVAIEENKNNFKKPESENIPQYIIQLQSYTSPTIKNIDEQKAEEAVLNGITSSLFIYGKEIKGILFLSRNNILCFISSEGEGKDGEIDIVLDNIKKIYFNVKGGLNMKNYEKKNDEERFIKLVEINDETKDIKFNNEEDFESFIKGLILVFKNKTNGVNKNIIYNIVRNSLRNSTDATNILKQKNNLEVKEQYENNNYRNIEENNIYNKEEEIIGDDNDDNNNVNKKEKEDDDIIVTTTVTEVFKDGELINKETREKMDGVVQSLHVYSPDTDEYEIFLKNTKLGQKQLVRRLEDGLPVESVNSQNENSIYNEINYNSNENEVKEEDEFKEQD